MTEVETVDVVETTETTETVELTTQELVAQRKELDARIAAAKKAESAEAMKQIVGLMQTYDITAEAVAKATAKSAKAKAPKTSKDADGNASDGRAKVAPKFQDPVSGKTWTGRGKQPKWFDAETAVKL